MSDILGDETESPVDPHHPQGLQPPNWFDEEAYLLANPDVAESMANGEFRSAFHHFIMHGREEQRPLRPRVREPSDAESVDARLLDARSLDAGRLDARALDAGALDARPLSEAPLSEAPLDGAPLNEAPLDSPPRTEPQYFPETKPPDWFDEEAYLRANPDVAESLANGEFRSPFHHFRLHGREERRPLRPRPSAPLDELPPAETPAETPAEAAAEQAPPKPKVAATFEGIILSPSGGLFLIGWVDDMSSPLEWIEVSGPNWVQTVHESNLTRQRRTDVEAALGANRIHRFGYFAFTYKAEPFDTGGDCKVRVHLRDGVELEFEPRPRRVSDLELRNMVLSFLPGTEVFGNREVEANSMLRGMLKATIVRHNRDITRAVVAGAYVERFGARPRTLRGSMVICLYGKPQYMFLQSALFAGGAGFEDYEMIYVSNSPEMAEQLMKDARAGAIVYDLPQTLVLLPGNAGFGAANNVAVEYASSDRILVVNPDVFPRDADWARKHTRIVADLPPAQTQLFGAPLYYDDGSLMHGGMYFEYDTGVSADEAHMTSHRLVRVEHYGKGAPAFSNRYTKSRPVPAITGAFMSVSRPWYEKLGGFTEDFVFGSYEDADLCLKSLSAGVAAWIHDLRLWHMEGKGSTRLPVHEGGAHVNRSLFSERWEAYIATGLEGPNPSHPLLQGPLESDTTLARASSNSSAQRGRA